MAGRGATEIQWRWGDGTTTPWLPFCGTHTAEHRFPAAGTYTVRASLRTCRDPAIDSAPIPVVVSTATPPQVLAFAAQGCTLGFCLFAPGEPVRFDQSFAGAIESYLYDWDGDGTFEQVAASPVLSHAYPTPGIYQPALRVVAGAQSATRRHATLILIDGSRAEKKGTTDEL